MCPPSVPTEKDFVQEDEEIIRKFLNQEMPYVKNQVLIRPMKTRLPKLGEREQQEALEQRWESYSDCL